MTRLAPARTALAALAVLCAFGASSDAATKIDVLYTATSGWASVYVAKDQAMFETKGLDVSLTFSTNGSLITGALVADTSQLGALTPTVPIMANEQGLDLVAIAGTIVYPPVDKRTVLSGVLVATGSGITGPQQLLGKRVGVPGIGGIVDVLTRKWVATKGVEMRQVNWVEIAFPQMGDALKGHLADAVSLVDPFYSHVVGEKIGYSIGTYLDVVPPGVSPGYFIATRAWASAHAEAARAFRAALEDAIRYAQKPENLGAVQASIAKWTKLPLAAVASQPLPSTLDAGVDPKSFQFWIELSREQGLIKGNPDPKSFVF